MVNSRNTERHLASLANRARLLIAPIVRECPPECGVVAITDVKISSDFAYATVLISALQKPEVALKYLESRQRDLQKLLGRIGTKSTPKLRLRIDRDGERSARLDALLERGDA
jgi:ribosome-binding factor A